jgi:hypothetical protein
LCCSVRRTELSFSRVSNSACRRSWKVERMMN